MKTSTPKFRSQGDGDDARARTYAEQARAFVVRQAANEAAVRNAQGRPNAERALDSPGRPKPDKKAPGKRPQGRPPVPQKLPGR
ncbi:MAG: hypothetical protein KKA22_09095 [Gammaproteobacteria bacterium]|jgi:hypothetical protein|nr:hypothetical protein [Gammaproteobacteria bacterium]MBU1408285.1 hypothetical protein [Gammaproteobacteria bacterium]MBU1532098.1 hypothetical protein [Gammaproteobacteria bacterium]